MHPDTWNNRWTVADAISPLLAGRVTVAAADVWTALGKPDAAVRSLMDRIHFNSAMRALGWRCTDPRPGRGTWRKWKVTP